jgi:hypothetical protein
MLPLALEMATRQTGFTKAFASRTGELLGRKTW